MCCDSLLLRRVHGDMHHTDGTEDAYYTRRRLQRQSVCVCVCVCVCVRTQRNFLGHRGFVFPSPATFSFLSSLIDGIPSSVGGLVYTHSSGPTPPLPYPFNTTVCVCVCVCVCVGVVV